MKAFGERLSRHYYDVAMLSKSPAKDAALANPSLLAAVVKHKSLFFRTAWASYEDAKRGSLKLAPHDALEKSLRADYAKMAEMIFGDSPAFDSIIAALALLEKAINEAV